VRRTLVPGLRSVGAAAFVLLALAPPVVGQRIALSARLADSTVALSLDPAASPSLWRALSWRPVQPGLEWTELELSAGVLRIPVRAILVRVEPARFDFRLQLVTEENRMTGAWTPDSVPAAAALALNAGQFRETGPWGWVVVDGGERRNPGRGPLSVGIAVTEEGAIRWILPGDLRAARDDRSIEHAFQSYPLLRFDGRVPPLALDPALVDQDHRDARLILSERDDGSLLIVLTRFDVLGPAAERVPIGLTLPESVALMGALGARHAVMLDGGVSAQLLLRGPDSGERVWRGARRVPLALVATPRPD
jgi:hypothetical protein